jgi:hypothetical protein
MRDVLSTPTHGQIRAELQELILRDLLGPAGGEEEIVDEQYVRDRYILGLLAPKGQNVIPEEQEDLAVAEGDTEEGTVEPPTIRNSTFLPSSLGLTFTVDNSVKAIQIKARWGRYERLSSEELGLEFDKPRMVWKRLQFENTSAPIPLTPGRMSRWIPNPNYPDVYVDGLFRQRSSEWVITLFLVNSQEEPKKLRDIAWLFQPELTVTSPDGEAIFCRRRFLQPINVDDEEKAMQMLYRQQVEFAVGHGVAVHAELANGRYDQAVSLKTVVAPNYELPQVTSPTPDEIPGLQELMLDMKALSELANGDLASALNPLVAAYENWIQHLEQSLDQPSEDLKPYLTTACQTIDICKQNLKRIQTGISLLGENPQAAEAFRFANRAMWLQRIHTLYAESVRREEGKSLQDMDTVENRT